MKAKERLRWIGIGAVTVCVLVCWALVQGITIEEVRAWQMAGEVHVATSPQWWKLSYFILMVVISALCLPGAGILLLLAGAGLPLAWALGIGLLGSSLGSCLTLWWVRTQWPIKAGGDKRRVWLNWLNDRLQHRGWVFLISVRLMPIIPFNVLNVVAGWSEVRVWTFFWTAMIGMLPGTALYLFAGKVLLNATQGGVSSVQWWYWVGCVVLGIFGLIGVFKCKVAIPVSPEKQRLTA